MDRLTPQGKLPRQFLLVKYLFGTPLHCAFISKLKILLFSFSPCYCWYCQGAHFCKLSLLYKIFLFFYQEKEKGKATQCDVAASRQTA
jgi:hypothetical protein